MDHILETTSSFIFYGLPEGGSCQDESRADTSLNRTFHDAYTAELMLKTGTSDLDSSSSRPVIDNEKF